MKRTTVLILGVLITASALFISARSNEEGYEVGEYAADFELPNIDGEMVSMESYTNAKGFIVVFTCNTCPYAKMYEQRIIDLDKTFASKGYPVIAINPNDIEKQPGDSMEEMQKRSSDKGYSFPYLRDDDQDVTRAFGATKTPHVYVLNKESEGKYKVEYIGAIDDNPRDASDVSNTYVEDAVNSLMQGSTPTVKAKRAIGCTIKWKDA